jgi:hypothetical protein
MVISIIVFFKYNSASSPWWMALVAKTTATFCQGKSELIVLSWRKNHVFA